MFDVPEDDELSNLTSDLFVSNLIVGVSQSIREGIVLISMFLIFSTYSGSVLRFLSTIDKNTQVLHFRF